MRANAPSAGRRTRSIGWAVASISIAGCTLLSVLQLSAQPRCAWSVNILSLDNILRLTQSTPGHLPEAAVLDSACSEGARYQVALSDEIDNHVAAAISGYQSLTKSERSILATLRTANLFEQSGNHAAALQLWRKVGADRTFSATGEAALKAGDLPQARAALELALEINHSSVSALRGLGQLHERERDWQQAERHYEAALALAPDDAKVQYGLGHVKLELRDYMAASAHGARAVALTPNDPWAYVLTGNAYRLQKDYATAATWYQQLLNFDDWKDLGMKFLGINALEQGNAELALSWLVQVDASHTGGQPAEMFYWLGQTYMALGSLPQAQHEFEQALDAAPTNALYNMSLGDLFRRQGDLDRARQAYLIALQLEPDNESIKVRLSSLEGP